MFLTIQKVGVLTPPPPPPSSPSPTAVPDNRVDVRGRKYGFGPTQANFTKMSSEKGKSIFRPKNINSITITIISEGIQKRNQIQYSEQYLERCRRCVGVYFIVQKLLLSHNLQTLAEHRKIGQKNLCF